MAWGLTGRLQVEGIAARVWREADELGLRTVNGLASAAVVVLSIAAGLVTNRVPSQWSWGLLGWGLALSAIACVWARLAWYLAERPKTSEQGQMLTAAEQDGNPPQSVGVPGMAPGDRCNPVVFAPDGPDSGSLVDRVAECEQLKWALDADRSNVIVVHGPPGAGKSRLVDSVLRNTGLDARARVHELASGEPFDAKTLLDDIDSAAGSSAGLRPGEDVLSRLEVAMETRDDTPVPIVVEDAQYLFAPDTPFTVSQELAEVLDVIASRQERRVKVILLVREPIPSEPWSGWRAAADYVFVGGLEAPDFKALLAHLDPDEKLGMALKPDSLHEVLQGSPRLARLFRAVLGLSQGQVSADGLMGLLGEVRPEGRERLLAHAVVESLSPGQRHVVAALAAFGAPVSTELVSDLLREHQQADHTAALLETLAGWDVIGRTSNGYYYLPVAEMRDAALGSEAPKKLLTAAIASLYDYRERWEDNPRPEDLHWQFMELDIKIRDLEWDASYDRINDLEKALRPWNATESLIPYRKAIAGHLSNSFREMVNYNALGCTYLSRGSFEEARKAFGSAWRSARGEPDGRRKIYINLAALYWETGDTKTAERYYRAASATAKRRDDPLDRMAVAAGLADCFRRWGDYSTAFRYGEQALDIAKAVDSPWSVGIAVKLARWHSELNERDKADSLMNEAEVAACHTYPGLRVQCLNGRAALLLDAGDIDKAEEAAQQARDEALKLHDPVMVLRARTAIAMAYLKRGDIRAASVAIDRAARYRRPERDLIVLALQALIASRDGHDDEARDRFGQLKTEAVRCRERDNRDFAAWEFEGLARCGADVGGDASLDQAVAAFRHARKLAAAPALVARLKCWLEILEAKPGQLAPVVDAATHTGGTAGPVRSGLRSAARQAGTARPAWRLRQRHRLT